MQFNVMASAESVVSEQNPLNKRSDLKDLKFINPESWPVVMCGSSQRDRWPHRARAAVPNSTPGTHTFNANSARNQQLRGTECGVWGLGAGLPLPMVEKARPGEVHEPAQCVSIMPSRSKATAADGTTRNVV